MSGFAEELLDAEYPDLFDSCVGIYLRATSGFSFAYLGATGLRREGARVSVRRLGSPTGLLGRPAYLLFKGMVAVTMAVSQVE